MRGVNGYETDKRILLSARYKKDVCCSFGITAQPSLRVSHRGQISEFLKNSEILARSRLLREVRSQWRETG